MILRVNSIRQNKAKLQLTGTLTVKLWTEKYKTVYLVPKIKNRKLSNLLRKKTQQQELMKLFKGKRDAQIPGGEAQTLLK